MAATFDMQALLKGNFDVVKTMARASELLLAPIPEGWASVVSGSMTIGLNVAGAVDIAKERAKIEKEIEETKAYLVATGDKLRNQEFLAKAPTKVKEEMERKYGEAEAKVKVLTERLGL